MILYIYVNHGSDIRFNIGLLKFTVIGCHINHNIDFVTNAKKFVLNTPSGVPYTVSHPPERESELPREWQPSTLLGWKD